MKRIRFNRGKREFYVELINEGKSKILDRSKTGTDSLFRKHPDLLED